MLIGIDQGTTGTTCVALDLELNPVASAYRSLPNRYPRPGWVEQNPDEIVDTVVEAVAEVLSDVRGREVLGAGLANQGETVVAWDRRTGSALAPALVWSDKRADGVTSRLRDDGLADDVERLSGLRLDTYFSAAKMRWLLENDAAVIDANESGVLALGTLDTWLAVRLGDQPAATDHSTASRTQLYSPYEDDWNAELLGYFGVPHDGLAPIRPSLGYRGQLRHPSWARAVPWYASLVDQPASLAGNACFVTGDTKVTYGTGCFASINAGHEPQEPPAGLISITAWSELTSRTFAVEGGAFTAGTALEWLKNIGVVTDTAETDVLARSVSRSDSVRFLPALTGFGAPWWQDTAGVLSGLSGATSRGHLAKAVLDSIAFRVRDILEAAWAGGLVRPDALRVDGGLTQNRYLMQRQADVLGIPLALSRMREATAVGVAALAGVASGLLTYADVGQLLSPVRHLVPGDGAVDCAEEYETWRNWVEQTCRLQS